MAEISQRVFVESVSPIFFFLSEHFVKQNNILFQRLKENKDLTSLEWF